MIDRGVDVGLPFDGAHPDLGPFEFEVLRLISVDAVSMTPTGLNLHVELIDTLAERLVAEERFLAGSNEGAALENQAARWIAQELLGSFTPNSHR